MFGTNVVARGLTLGKVLSGISRGLSIANQVIPIYEQAKPMIGNARKLMSAIKEFKNMPATSTPPKKELPQLEAPKKTINNSNSPTSQPIFFQ